MFIVEVQGQVFRVRDTSRKPIPPDTPPKRGNVESFSAASRRRLIDFLARMDDSYKRATFVTLTFHSPPTAVSAYAALKRFLMYVRRWFPEASGVWRREYQPDRGAIHFHIIFFNLPYWPQFHLQDIWTRCTDEVLSIAHIKLIRKFSTYMSYISKYVAKADSPSENPSLVNPSYQHNLFSLSAGRCWGWVNKKALPVAQLIEIEVNDEDFGRYAMWSISALSRGRSGESTYSQKLYTVEASALLQFTVDNCVGFTPIREISEAEFMKSRQWFGSPAVPGGAGVPLAGEGTDPPLTTHARVFSKAGCTHHALEMPAGEAS